jgi:hypothetical protein
LLPNVLSALVYGRAEYPVNRRGSISRHVRHQAAVNIHRNGDARMPKALLHNLGVDLRGKHVAGMAMPETVKGNPPLFQELGHGMRQAARLERRSIGLR